MQGRKQIEPQLFYQLSLEQMVPEDHLVRRLAAALHLSWVRAATARHYSHLGRPSLDPVVIAKLLLLGYLYDIRSERQLMRDVQVNLAYRWYLGYDLNETIPDHSDLSKARRRFGLAFFQALFDEILAGCQQAGLVGGQTVLMDSTVVQADASLDSVTTLRYRPAEYWQQLEQAAEAPTPTPELPATTETPTPAEETPKPIGHKRPRPQRTCDRKYSLTDPEASVHHRRGKAPKVAYKAHFMADASHGVITAVTATAASEDDTAVVPELIDKHETRCGRPQQAVADQLYGSQDCLGYLQEKGIETVIRPRQGGNKHGGLSKRKFIYDAEQDVYRCPGGAVLHRRRRQRKDGKAFYSADAAVCRFCPLRPQCVRSKSPDAVRQVTRFDNGYVERAQAACGSPHGQRLLQHRQTCIEGLFGQAKNWHGLGRARWRGQVKMKIQTLLTAAVLNLKKLLKAVSRKPALASRVPGRSASSLPIGLLCLILDHQLRSALINVGDWRNHRELR
jgi:transposase